ncbi:MAG: amidohydrolase family protein [Erysipelotrichaceae bacterium]|nr:amidohydrolase family protein [Erysipelotrichaceae bacterium]
MYGLKNGTVHDGKGQVFKADLIIENDRIAVIAPNIDDSTISWIDCTGLLIFPGFIDCASEWGIMQKGQELKGEVKDNDEKIDPFTPEMDVQWAFNGRCITEQEIYTYGITGVGVLPSNSNIFGGLTAAYDSRGLNPMKMMIRQRTGMKLCVNQLTKKAYGPKNLSPMTRMGIFSILEQKLREASEYQPNDEKTKRDEKLAVLHQALQDKLPFFVSANSSTEILNAFAIIKPYKVPVIFVNGYGVNDSLSELIGNQSGLVVASVTTGFNMESRKTDYESIIRLHRKGLPVALTAFGDNVFPGKEELLWTGIKMYQFSHDAEEVLSMMTSTPAKMLGIIDDYGTIEPGKIANLVIWSHNPLITYQGRVLKTILNGNVIYETEENACY